MALTTASYDIGQKLFSGAASELVNFIRLQGADGQVFVPIPAVDIVPHANPEFSSRSGYGANDVRIKNASTYCIQETGARSLCPCLMTFQLQVDTDCVIQLLGASQVSSVSYYQDMDILAQTRVFANDEDNLYNKVELSFIPNVKYDSFIIAIYDRHTTTTIMPKDHKVNIVVMKDLVAMNNFNFVKMAIQSSPETNFVINGELFKIGKSGKFELYNKNIEIYSLGVAPVILTEKGTDKILGPFVVTYKWKPSH